MALPTAGRTETRTPLERIDVLNIIFTLKCEFDSEGCQAIFGLARKAFFFGSNDDAFTVMIRDRNWKKMRVTSQRVSVTIKHIDFGMLAFSID